MSVELRITKDGQEILGLYGDGMALAPGEDERGIALAALAEAVVMLCGTRTTADEVTHADITFHRAKPKLAVVKTDEPKP